MFCAISGEVPKEPVCAPKTGLLYEKSIITKALEATGKCPVTGQQLEDNDLVVIKSSKVVAPRPPTGNAVPNLLQTLSTEWDTLMLEMFELKQQLQNTREELVRTLYERDAAVRVIARLQRELESAKAGIADSNRNVEMKDVNGIESNKVDAEDKLKLVLKNTAETLNKFRIKNKKVVPAGLCSPEQVGKFGASATVKAHLTTKPGVTCVDVSQGGSTLVSGGVDGQLKVLQLSEDLSSANVLATLNGHEKKVNQVAFAERKGTIVSCSKDKTAIIWGSSMSAEGSSISYESYKAKHVIKVHNQNVVSCSVHPSYNYVGTLSSDGLWALTEIDSGECVSSANVDLPGTFSAFHPDGLLVGIGSEQGVIRIWDAMNASKAADLSTGSSGIIASLSFSNNGYHLAAASEKQVLLFDLRKQKVIKTFDFDANVTSCAYDRSGYFLAAAESSGKISTFHAKGKEYKPLSTLSEHTGEVVDVKFGPNASFLVSASMDRSMIVYK